MHRNYPAIQNLVNVSFAVGFGLNASGLAQSSHPRSSGIYTACIFLGSLAAATAETVSQI